jgi:hypothetical protein
MNIHSNVVKSYQLNGDQFSIGQNNCFFIIGTHKLSLLGGHIIPIIVSYFILNIWKWVVSDENKNIQNVIHYKLYYYTNKIHTQM